ncbi:MAG: hypothetical protein JSS74_04225 [Actinobacteria bacterium]|nr:hypothetical protein [Actinomycetota bacterium]
MSIQTTTAADALTRFLDVWTGDMSADLAPKLTCGEADALAQLLRTHGRPAAAAEWINFHSRGDDDEEDAHHRTPAAAMMFELDEMTAAYPDLTQEFEDPEAFGAGHIVLYSLDGRQRLAITERCDKPAADETCVPIGWQWEAAHRLVSGGWEPIDAGELEADDLDSFVPRAWEWVGKHGGTRGL